jgi:very-short-patch-repair endonuclease
MRERNLSVGRIQGRSPVETAGQISVMAPDQVPPSAVADFVHIRDNIGNGRSSIDAALAVIATWHGGHISRAELLALGVTSRQIQHRIGIGRLAPVYNGVYAVGHRPTRPEARAAGALLACGPRSALSHRSAATAWGIWRHWREPFELTAAVHRRPRGLLIHQSHTLLARDVKVRDGLRVTSAARTLVDLAPRLTEQRLTRALNDLRLWKVVDPAAVDDVLARNMNHRARAALVRLIAEAQEEPTRSELEDAFLKVVRGEQLPVPEVNVHIGPYRVDALFGDRALVVELDGWATHKTWAAFQRDRRQDQDILAYYGIPTVRLTYFETTREARSTAERLRRIFGELGVE